MKEIKLPFVPATDDRDGIHILYKPSKKWLKNHPYEFPHGHMDIISGQQIYPLPKELQSEDIFMVHYPDVQTLGKIIKPLL